MARLGSDRHPSVAHVSRYFEAGHLPNDLAVRLGRDHWSSSRAATAQRTNASLASSSLRDSAELTVALYADRQQALAETTRARAAEAEATAEQWERAAEAFAAAWPDATA